MRSGAPSLEYQSELATQPGIRKCLCNSFTSVLPSVASVPAISLRKLANKHIFFKRARCKLTPSIKSVPMLGQHTFEGEKYPCCT